MDALQIAAANMALQKMFKGGHFDICAVRNIISMTGGVPTRYDMEILQLLHCVDFVDMPPEVRSELPNVLQRVLGSDSIHIGECPKTIETSSYTTPVSSLSKLRFWG